MTTDRARVAAAGYTRRRRGPSQWQLLDANGKVVGQYGGRAGDRWAENLRDGRIVTEGTAASASTVLGVLLADLRRQAE